MLGLSADIITLLNYLLPGFLSAWLIYSFTTHRKPPQFERLIQALIFSGIISVLVSGAKALMLWIGQFVRLADWSETSEVAWSYAIALLFGLLTATALNKDFPHKLIRKLGLTSRVSYPSVWHCAFSTEPCYIVLHLNDERRLYGWPLMWPSGLDNESPRVLRRLQPLREWSPYEQAEQVFPRSP